jgi:hypothetical protein
MSSNQARHAQGQVLVTAAFIGSLAMALAAGLKTLGLTDQANAAITGLMCQALQPGAPPAFAKALPPWQVWLGTALAAYGLALAMLGVPGTWRRLVLWTTTLLLVAAWAPVLALAAHAPEVAAPFTAALWAGVCTLVYTHSHRMPCDQPPV